MFSNWVVLFLLFLTKRLSTCGLVSQPSSNSYLKPCEALTRHIQDLVQRWPTEKPGILGILEYSESFNNCIPTHIQKPVKFTKIYEYSEL